MSALHIRITGYVQGVFFRKATVEKASVLNLKGWVRNYPDGSVEIHAEGKDEDLVELEEWCHTGPPAAKVENVVSETVEEEGYTTFVTRHE